MPAPTIPQLDTIVMTKVVNKMKTSLSFLKDLVFPTDEPVHTEAIEYDTIVGDRKMAPFIEKGSEGTMLSGYGDEFRTVEPPNIRVKRPMLATDAFYKRAPGGSVYPTSGEQIAEIDRKVNQDLKRLADACDNATEWLCAQALRGVIQYSYADKASFKITYPRSGSHTVILGTFWNEPNSSPSDDFFTAAGLINSDSDRSPTHCLMSESAARVFRKHPEVLALLDNKNVNAGIMDLQAKFQASGAMYLGVFGGIQCWMYNRKVNIEGADEMLIRDKYVEFVTALPEAENVCYYGGIADWGAKNGGDMATKRFSKSWEIEDPSSRVALVHTRPLPVMRIPDTTLSMKVVSG